MLTDRDFLLLLRQSRNAKNTKMITVIGTAIPMPTFAPVVNPTREDRVSSVGSVAVVAFALELGGAGSDLAVDEAWEGRKVSGIPTMELSAFSA